MLKFTDSLAGSMAIDNVKCIAKPLPKNERTGSFQAFSEDVQAGTLRLGSTYTPYFEPDNEEGLIQINDIEIQEMIGSDLFKRGIFYQVFVTGHGEITDDDFYNNYEKAIISLHNMGLNFLVGDHKGVDDKAQKLMKRIGAKYKVFHMHSTPRNYTPSEKSLIQGGYESDLERDEAMIAKSDAILVWVAEGREGSGTSRNLNLWIDKKNKCKNDKENMVNYYDREVVAYYDPVNGIPVPDGKAHLYAMEAVILGGGKFSTENVLDQLRLMRIQGKIPSLVIIADNVRMEINEYGAYPSNYPPCLNVTINLLEEILSASQEKKKDITNLKWWAK
jgi:hypothetical protein